MGNWVKDQFLQKPVPDPWIKWNLEDLEYATNARLEYPANVRKKIRIEIRTRRQGKRAAQSKTEPR